MSSFIGKNEYYRVSHVHFSIFRGLTALSFNLLKFEKWTLMQDWMC